MKTMDFQVFCQSVSVSVIALFGCGHVVPLVQAGSTCSGTSPRVCVDRVDLNSPGPVPYTDFFFNFADSSNPDVTLKTGVTDYPWRVWSQVSLTDTTPANLGDITIEASSINEGFAVELRNPNNDNPGCANLQSAVLYDDTNWTGNSSIVSGSVIAGNLTGALRVVRDSEDSGGTVHLAVNGNVSGTMTVPVLTYLAVNGDLSGDLSIAMLPDLAELQVMGNVASTSTIEIVDHQSGVLSFNLGGEVGEFDFAGDIVILPTSSFESNIVINGLFLESASIDLNEADLTGDIVLTGGGSGSIIDVGEVMGTGQILLLDGVDHRFGQRHLCRGEWQDQYRVALF